MVDRAERQARQAAAFDAIGERYDEAFPEKGGQLAAGAWLVSQLETGARVLDIGCGTGVPTARDLYTAGMSVVGVDISAQMLDLARRNVPAAEFHQRDALGLDSSLGSFGGAVSFFSLLMLPRTEIPPALSLVHDRLEPGAPFALGMVEADLDDVPIPFLGNPVHVSAYPRDELRALVESAGFEVRELREVRYEPTAPDRPPEVQLFLYCHRGYQ